MLTRPDFTSDQQWGDVACDSYHNVKRDVEMLRELGVSRVGAVRWPHEVGSDVLLGEECGALHEKQAIEHLRNTFILFFSRWKCTDFLCRGPAFFQRGSKIL